MNPNKAKQRSSKKNIGTATLVLASSKAYTRHNLPHYEVASYKCECGHEGAVQAALKTPHCAHCGTGVVIAKKSNTTVARLETETSTVSLLCGSCNTHNIMASTAALGFDGSAHCSNCGSHMEYDKAEIASSEDFDDETDLTNDTGSDDVVDAIHSSFKDDDVDIEDEVEEADVDEDTLDDESEDSDDVEESNVDDELGDDENIDELSDTGEEDDEVREADDYLGGDIADSPDEDEGETEDDLEDESVVSKVKVEPISIVASLGKKAVATVRIVQEASGDRIHLFAKDHCIATLKKDDTNKRSFGHPKHIELIQSSLEDAGLDATVADLGFVLATVKPNDKKALEATVAKLQKATDAKVNSKVKEHAKVMRESLEIAAVGLNRDVFAATISNPLKDGMLKLLSSVGVDNVTAAIQVQDMFSRCGDEYVEVLLEKAHEIAGYGSVVRAQLASTYATLSPPIPNLKAVVANTAEEEEPDEADEYFSEENAGQNCTVHQDNYGATGESVTARLEKPLRRVTESAKTQGGSNKGLFSKSSLSFAP